MQLQFSFVPHFPTNLEGYAPWVAQRGLVAPYGECQCGACGQRTRIANQTNSQLGWRNGEPIPFVIGHGTKTPADVRFWSMVDKSGPNDCWLWTGSRNHGGYGKITVDQRRTYAAHRYSYELHFGPIPDGLFVLHDCPGGDNSRCVNPAHLWLGTHGDNMADKVAKGRQASGDRNGSRLHRERLPRGERHGMAKLGEDDVRSIRLMYAAGEYTQRRLCAKFGIGQHTIWQIINRRTWAHVE